MDVDVEVSLREMRVVLLEVQSKILKLLETVGELEEQYHRKQKKKRLVTSPVMWTPSPRYSYDLEKLKDGPFGDTIDG